MKKYEPDLESCPKCGRFSIELTFISAEIEEVNSSIMGRPTRGEYLRIKCVTCGYQWIRAPIDSKDAK